MSHKLNILFDPQSIELNGGEDSINLVDDFFDIVKKYRDQVRVILWTEIGVQEQKKFLEKEISRFGFSGVPTLLFDGHTFFHPDEIYRNFGGGLKGSHGNYLYRLQEVVGTDDLTVLHIGNKSLEPVSENKKYIKTDRFKNMAKVEVIQLNPEDRDLLERLEEILRGE